MSDAYQQNDGPRTRTHARAACKKTAVGCRPPNLASKGTKKSTKLSHATARRNATDAGNNDSDDDDEVQVVYPVLPPVVLVAATSHVAGGPGLHDGDVEVVGTLRGDIFMHARHDCTTFPVGCNDPMICCHKCCCYICDTLAADCPAWSEHCRADPRLPKWHKLRLSARYIRDRPQRSLSVSRTPPPPPEQAARSTASINSSTVCRRPRTTLAARRSTICVAARGSSIAHCSRWPLQKTSPGSSGGEDNVFEPIFRGTRSNRHSANRLAAATTTTFSKQHPTAVDSDSAAPVIEAREVENCLTTGSDLVPVGRSDEAPNSQSNTGAAYTAVSGTPTTLGARTSTADVIDLTADDDETPFKKLKMTKLSHTTATRRRPEDSGASSTYAVRRNPRRNTICAAPRASPMALRGFLPRFGEQDRFFEPVYRGTRSNRFFAQLTADANKSNM